MCIFGSYCCVCWGTIQVVTSPGLYFLFTSSNMKNILKVLRFMYKKIILQILKDYLTACPKVHQPKFIVFACRKHSMHCICERLYTHCVAWSRRLFISTLVYMSRAVTVYLVELGFSLKPHTQKYVFCKYAAKPFANSKHIVLQHNHNYTCTHRKICDVHAC